MKRASSSVVPVFERYLVHKRGTNGENGQTVEAGELLVMVLRQEAGALRQAAYEALSHLDNADVLPILRQHHEIEMDPQVRETLGELLRRH